jgi:hypothetical protein
VKELVRCQPELDVTPRLHEQAKARRLVRRYKIEVQNARPWEVDPERPYVGIPSILGPKTYLDSLGPLNGCFRTLRHGGTHVAHHEFAAIREAVATDEFDVRANAVPDENSEVASPRQAQFVAGDDLPCDLVIVRHFLAHPGRR